MIIGIDGSNLRTGGSFTHLSRLLAAARPADHGIEEFRLWTAGSTAVKLTRSPFLNVIHDPMLDRRLWWRLYWQRARLPRLAAGCDVLYIPGGTQLARFSPFVTMSRNMLPFEWGELLRFRYSLEGIRLLLLRFAQTRTFRRADGLIFLTPYARDSVMRIVRSTRRSVVIPHGVDERFRAEPRPQLPVSSYSEQSPLRLLYVSTVDLYKHQWNVAEAAASLRRDGLPITLEFVGPCVPVARRRFELTLDRLDPKRQFLRYRGPVPFERLHTLREDADLFVFASSCENMPNTLIEAMASGFPIACANRGPMPEILGDAGVYFDPEDADGIETALRSLIEDRELRTRCAHGASERAKAYSWDRCARETLDFISEIAREGAR